MQKAVRPTWDATGRSPIPLAESFRAPQAGPTVAGAGGDQRDLPSHSGTGIGNGMGRACAIPKTAMSFSIPGATQTGGAGHQRAERAVRQALAGAHGDGRAGAADRLRQCGQPHAGARRRTAARNRHPAGSGRRPRTAAAATIGRRAAGGDRGRSARLAGGALEHGRPAALLPSRISRARGSPRN
jgi:hypothetical protein